jgi:hypothetical protein
MGLDVIEEKNLNDVMVYSLDYPNVVLNEAKLFAPEITTLDDFAYGLYLGYISGVFFDGFLARNKRYLDSEELSDFHLILVKRSSEIRLKIKTHLHLK